MQFGISLVTWHTSITSVSTQVTNSLFFCLHRRLLWFNNRWTLTMAQWPLVISCRRLIPNFTAFLFQQLTVFANMLTLAPFSWRTYLGFWPLGAVCFSSRPWPSAFLLGFISPQNPETWFRDNSKYASLGWVNTCEPLFFFAVNFKISALQLRRPLVAAERHLQYLYKSHCSELSCGFVY